MDTKANTIFLQIKDIIKLLYNYDSKLPNISLFYKLCFSNRTVSNQKIQNTMMEAFKTTLIGHENTFLTNDFKEASKFVVKYNEKIYFSFSEVFANLSESDKQNLLSRLACLYHLFFGSEKIKEYLSKQVNQPLKKKEDIADKLLNMAEGLADNKQTNPMLLLSNIMSSGFMNDLESEGDDGMEKMLGIVENLIKTFRSNKGGNMSRDDLKKIMTTTKPIEVAQVKQQQNNIGIFITKEQKEKINQLRDVLAKEIESKRDPNILYRFTPHAYIKTEVRAHFVSGEPKNIYFGEKDLGSFTLNRVGSDDFEYVIDKQTDFKKCLFKEIKTFYLEVSYHHDGCVGGWDAKVFDSKIGGNELVDLTDHELNSR